MLFILKDILLYLQLTFGIDRAQEYHYDKTLNIGMHLRIAPEVYDFAKVKVELMSHFGWSRAAILMEFRYGTVLCFN